MTSAFGVPAAAGIPVTQRGLASSVTVVTGQVGEPRRRGGPNWEALARAGGTLVILMGMTTAPPSPTRCCGGRAPDTPVAVIERGTTPASGWHARRWPVGRGRPGAARGDRGRTGGGAGPADARTGGCGSAGGPHGGGDPVGPRAPGLVDALSEPGRRRSSSH